jgi:hypothetical protein
MPDKPDAYVEATLKDVGTKIQTDADLKDVGTKVEIRNVIICCSIL